MIKRRDRNNNLIILLERTSSVVFYFAVLLFAFCFVRVIMHIVCPHVSANTWFQTLCKDRINTDAANRLLTILGIVNFTFPYMMNARGDSLYKIKLSPAIFARFKWHGPAYFLHALLVLLGLYSSGMGYLETTAACLLGAVNTLLSTSIVTWIVALNHDSAKNTLESYLTSFPKCEAVGRLSPHNYVQKRNELLFSCAKYTRNYFLSTLEVPKKIVVGMVNEMGQKTDLLDSLIDKKKPLLIYSYSGLSEGSESITSGSSLIVRELTIIRDIWEILLAGLNKKQQIQLIQSLILVMASEIPSKNLRYPSFPFDRLFTNILYDQAALDYLNKLPIDNSVKKAGFFMCGLLCYYRSKQSFGADSNTFWKKWNDHLDIVASVTLYAPTKEEYLANNRVFKMLNRYLVLITEATAVAEYVALRPDERTASTDFWKYLKNLLNKSDISNRWLPYFFAMGHAIVLSSSNLWYDPEKNMLLTYWALHRMEIMSLINK